MGSTVTIKTGREPESIKKMGLSFVEWSVHFVGSLLSMMLLRRLHLFSISRKKRPSLRDAYWGGNVPPVLRQPLVRLRNIHQSEEYFVNARGNIIHVRSYCPSKAEDVKALVLFCHGYGSHCNSPRKHEMGQTLRRHGLCAIEMDLEGHGYSGGERAYVEDYHHWVDDYRLLLELVAGEESEAARRLSKYEKGSRGGDETVVIAPHFFKIKPDLQRRLREVPVFISGESLGGALSILLGLSLYETKHPLLPRFKGEVLFAPAIKGNPPPSILVAFLRYFIVPLIPRWEIPSCLESVNRPDMCVLELEERRNVSHDVLGYPGGLGWGGNMRFRTGLNLIDLTEEVSRRLDEVKFPFLIMHDPGDGIVRFDSSEELAHRASTPHSSPRGRELRPMDGWLHCLITNCPEQTIQHFQDWVLYQTSLCSGESRDTSNGSDGDISCRHRLSRKSLSVKDSLGVVGEVLGDEGDSVDGRVGPCGKARPAFSERAWNGGDEGKVRGAWGSCKKSEGIIGPVKTVIDAGEDRRGVDDYACLRSHEGGGEAGTVPVGMERFVSGTGSVPGDVSRIFTESDSVTDIANRIFSESDLIPNGSVERCGNGFEGLVAEASGADNVIAKACVFRGSISSEDTPGNIIRPVPPSPDRVAGDVFLSSDCSTATSDIDDVNGIDDDADASPTAEVVAAAIALEDKHDDLHIESPSSSTLGTK